METKSPTKSLNNLPAQDRVTHSGSEMLTASEREQLRRRDREASAYARKVFKKAGRQIRPAT